MLLEISREIRTWRKALLPTPVFLPGELYRKRSLAGYSPWGHKELDTTERLALPFISFKKLPKEKGNHQKERIKKY